MEKKAPSKKSTPDQKQLASFARLPDMNPGPVMETDKSGIISLSNIAARNILGDQLNGTSWLDLCPEMDKKTWQRILRSRKVVALQCSIVKKEYIFHHRHDPQSDRVFIYGADVTEQRRAEKKLRESDALVRLLLNSTGEGIYGMDPEGRCNFANQACLKLLGYTQVNDLLGKVMHQLIHRRRYDGKEISFDQSRIYKALRRGEGVHVDDESIFRSDNTAFPAEYWSSPVRQDSKIIGCVVNFRDISYRKDSEILQNAYTNALAEIASFPEMNPGPVLRIDAQGKILRINEAAHILFGKQRMKNDWREICPELDDKTWNHILNTKTVILERQIGEHDFLFTHRRDFDSDLVFVFGTNITEQKQAERALQQAEKMAALGKLSAGLAHELNNPAAAAVRAAGQLILALENMQTAVSELYKTGIESDVWDLLCKWLFEFRKDNKEPVKLSPLEKCDLEEEFEIWLNDNNIQESGDIASIMVNAGINKKDIESITAAIPKTSRKQAIIWLSRIISAYNISDTIKNSTKSISQLVDVVKSYSHMDQAPQSYENIQTGIEDTLTLLAGKMRDTIHIKRQYAKDLPLLKVRGSELNQVWMNLIDNAIEAMQGQGTLTVCTKREGHYLVVEIGDTGKGIPPEIHSRIFEPFFTTKDTGQGTGLSLDVVHRIITRQFHGDIDVRSKAGDTVFKIRIPLEYKRNTSALKTTV